MAASEARIPGLAALILAGGRSTRFGSDKASALLAGRPLLDHVARALAAVCDDVVVVRAKGQVLPAVSVPVRVTDDRHEGLGPLAGMVAGFEVLQAPLAFVVSCDAPLVQPALVRLLAGEAASADIALPFANGFPQPLVAVYRVETCLPAFREAVERGDLKITAAFKGLRVRRVDEAALTVADPQLLSFRNTNTPEALAELAPLVER